LKPNSPKSKSPHRQRSLQTKKKKTTNQTPQAIRTLGRNELGHTNSLGKHTDIEPARQPRGQDLKPTNPNITRTFSENRKMRSRREYIESMFYQNMDLSSQFWGEGWTDGSGGKPVANTRLKRKKNSGDGERDFLGPCLRGGGFRKHNITVVPVKKTVLVCFVQGVFLKTGEERSNAKTNKGIVVRQQRPVVRYLKEERPPLPWRGGPRGRGSCKDSTPEYQRHLELWKGGVSTSQFKKWTVPQEEALIFP